MTEVQQTAASSEQLYDRIVVPLDGSEVAERALPEAIRLARATGAPLHLVRVIDLTEMEQVGTYSLALEYAGVLSLLEEEAKDARAYLDQQAKYLSDQGLAVTTELRQGTAGREIVAALKPGDVLVLASHGRTGLSRWFMGSIAEDVIRHATTPVLLIRAVQTPKSVSEMSNTSPERQTAPREPQAN